MRELKRNISAVTKGLMVYEKGPHETTASGLTMTENNKEL